MKKNKIYIVLTLLFLVLVLFLWMKKNPIVVFEIIPPIMGENSTDTSSVKLVFHKISAPSDLIVHEWVVGGDVINDALVHSLEESEPPEPGDSSSLHKNNIIYSLSSSCDCVASKESPTFQNTDTFQIIIDDVSPFRLSNLNSALV